MYCPVFAAAVTLASLAAARKCGTEEPGPEIIRANADAIKAYSIGAIAKAVNKPLIINTYVHVLRAGDALHEGNVPDDQIYAQVYSPPNIKHTPANTYIKMRVLNGDYASADISFKLIEINRPPINVDWFNDHNETAMRSALRRGTYADLNIYLQQPTTGILGYCYFPVGNLTVDLFDRDGCTVLFSTLPGGTTPDYNLGRTLTQYSTFPRPLPPYLPKAMGKPGVNRKTAK